MHLWHETSAHAQTTWRLARNGYTLTCTIVGMPGGACILRVQRNGQPVLDERCDGPQHALARSLEAFDEFAPSGWLHGSAGH